MADDFEAFLSEPGGDAPEFSPQGEDFDAFLSEEAPIPTPEETFQVAGEATPVDPLDALIGPTELVRSDEVDQLVDEAQPTGGIVQDALSVAEDVGFGFIEGGVRQLGSQANIATARAPEEILRPTSGTFASQVGEGLGQLTVQTATIVGAGAIGQAAIPIPGVGFAIGAGIGAAFTFFQGTRQELNEVEDNVRAQSDAEGEELELQVADARSKALPGVLVGEGLDAALAITTAGTGGLIRAVGGAGKAARQAEAARQITRLGKISNVVKGATIEGTGEAIQQASGEAAVTTAIEGGDFGDFLGEFVEEIPTAETGRAFAIGATVAGVAKGTAQANARFREGLEVAERATQEFSESGRVSPETLRIIELNQIMSDIESPNTPTQEVAISRDIATAEEIAAVISDEEGFELLRTEDGEFSILQGKADRLRELQEIANVVREKGEIAQAQKKLGKSRRRLARRLQSIREFEAAPVEILVNLQKANEQLEIAEDARIQILELEEQTQKPGIDRKKRNELLKREQEALELAEEALELSELTLSGREKKALELTREERSELLTPEEITSVFEESSQEAQEIGETLQETQEGAEARRETRELETTADKAERLADRLLSRIEVLENQTIGKDIQKDMVKAGIAEEQVELAQAKIDQIREESGVDGLTKAELTDIMSEVEGLEQFFRNLDKETLKSLGLKRKKDAGDQIVFVEDGPPAQEVTINEDGSSQVQESLLTELIPTDVGVNDTRPVEQLSSQENARNTNPKRSLFSIIERVKEGRRVKQIVKDASIQAQNLRQSIAQTATINAQILNRAVNRALQNNRVLNPVKAFREKTELLNSINQILIGNEPLESVPESLHSAIQEVRGHVDALSRQLIESGVVEGDVVQIIESNIGTYINRSYRVFDGPRWARNIDPRLVNRAKAYLREQLPDLSDQQLDIEIQELLYRAGGSPISFLVNKKSDSQFRKILLQKKEIPEEIRALWGERTGALENYAQTMLNMSSLIGVNNYIETIKGSMMGDTLFLEPRPGFSEPIKATPTNGGKGLVGPNGERLFTSPEFADLLNKTQLTGDLPFFYKTALRLVAGAKFAKTVPTVITQTRNFWANPWFLVSNGNFLELFNTESLKSAATSSYGLVSPTQFFDPDNPKSEIAKEFIEKLQRLGVLGEDVFTRELEGIRDDFFQPEQSLQDWINKDQQNKISQAQKLVKSGVTTPLEILTTIYRGSDAFFKVLGFLSEKRKLQQAFPNLSEAELELRAANIVRNTMPTYSLSPELVQQLRRIPIIAPFAVFQSEVIRTQYNTFNLAKEEMRDPATRSIGQKRLAGQVTAHMGLQAVVWAMSNWSGSSEEEEKDLRNVAAPWHQNKTLALLRPSEDGRKRRFVNMSFSSPYGIIQDPIATFGRADTWQEAFSNAADEVFGPFVSEDVLTRRVLDVSRNTIEGTSQKVYSELDDDSTKWRKSTLHVLGAFKPGALDSLQRFHSADEGFTSALLSELSGIKIVEMDMGDTAFFKGREFVEQKAEASSNFSSVIRRRSGPVSDAEIREAFDTLKVQREQAFSNLRSKYLSLIRLANGDKDLILDKLKDSGVGKNDLVFLEQNLVPKFTLSPQAQSKLNDIPGRMEQISRALGPDFDTLITKRKRDSFRVR